jgi:hypothetical protein
MDSCSGLVRAKRRAFGARRSRASISCVHQTNECAIEAKVFSNCRGTNWSAPPEVKRPSEAFARECTKHRTERGPAAASSASAPARTPSRVPASPITSSARQPALRTSSASAAAVSG